MSPAHRQQCWQRPPEGKPQRKLTALEKIICLVLHEAHKQQVEGVVDIFSEGPEGP